jgi:hypothetical protein
MFNREGNGKCTVGAKQLKNPFPYFKNNHLKLAEMGRKADQKSIIKAGGVADSPGREIGH